MSRIPFVPMLILAFSVAFAVHSLEFPGSVPDFRKASGGGVLLDVKPAFSEEAVYQRLESYGEEGRRVYRFRNLTVDIVLPLAVFPALFLAMWIVVKGSSLNRIARVLLIAQPILFLVFDFAENATVLLLLAEFPARSPLLASVLPYLTVIKRVGSLLSILVPLGFYLKGRMRRSSAA